MSLLQKLKYTDPKKGVEHIAIETLTKQTQIRQFYDEYVAYLRRYGNSKQARENPESLANRKIGYVLGCYNEKIADRWMKAIPSISHPIFGKDIFKVVVEQAYKHVTPVIIVIKKRN